MIKSTVSKWWLPLILVIVSWISFETRHILFSFMILPRVPLDSHDDSMSSNKSYPIHFMALRQLTSVFDYVKERRLQRFRRPYSRVSHEPPDFQVTEDLENFPRNALGFLCRDNPKVTEMGVDCKLISRNHLGFGCDKRIEDLARERGRDLNRIPSIFRSARVADACPDTCGLCVLCAPGCAKWFVGNSFCEPECNNSQCKYDEGDCWDTNCLVGEWQEWSECSIPCDPDGKKGVGGVETRTRKILRQPTLNGKPCPSLIEHKTGCNKGVLCPVPCEVSKWGEWSPCSSLCGPGESIRTRSILQAPQHGAEECPELVQTRSCFMSECQKECITSEWSDWSVCSNECGNGTKIRKRNVLYLPIGNKTCPSLIEEMPCKGTSCLALVARVCNVQEWGEWTPCSAECDGGVQTRQRDFILDQATRETELTPFNASCPSHAMIQQQDCNLFPCDIDCVVSDWGDWTECSGECNTAKQFRSRSILRQSAGGGVNCPDPEALVQEKPCVSFFCPQDCIVSPWSPWSDCHVKEKCGKGYITRTRQVITVPHGDGEKCPILQEFEECSIPCEQPCQFGPYSSWTPCKDGCQSQQASETRTLYSNRWKKVSFGTKNCLIDPLESMMCDNFTDICGEVSDKDCLVSEWEPWGVCSRPCGGGTRRRFRTVLREPLPSGKSCPVLIQEEECGTSQCATDCVTSEWSSWSSCSVDCGLGVQARSKSILSPASVDPPGSCEVLTQKRSCLGELGDCRMAHVKSCEVSDWSPWSNCSAPCGSLGSQYRSREILRLPTTMTEQDCPPLYEDQECNQFPCQQECLLSDWSPWSKCSIDCGTPGLGEQIRTRQILRLPSESSPPCPEHRQETRPCLDLKPCPIPCILSDWLEWSPCSAPCGIGEVHRLRQVLQQPAFGGTRCSALNDTASCFIKPCVTDCVMSEWGPSTECSAKCGGGTRQRRREVIIKPSNGGRPCSTLVDYEECNTFPCSESSSEVEKCKVSEWSAWSVCPVQCGGGVTVRSRVILHEGSPGEVCPSLEERRGCGLSRCKTEIGCKDRIGALEAFHVTCQILFAQGCDRNLKDLAESQGMTYPMENPPEARVKDVCPQTCNVCQECSPGCQLRDKGNTVCDEECNNEACEFDLGDCGKDCPLPTPLPRGLRVTPDATGIDIGERVEVVCRDKFERFKAAPEFPRGFVTCSDASTLIISNVNEMMLSMPSSSFLEDNTSPPSQSVLKLEPENLRFAFFHSPFVLEQLSQEKIKENRDKKNSVLGSIFQCFPDPCPSVYIEGISKENLVFPSDIKDVDALQDTFVALNGIFDRAESDSGLPFYRQPPIRGRPLSKLYVFGAQVMRNVKRSLSDVSHAQVRHLQSPTVKSSVYWYITPEDLFSENHTLEFYESMGKYTTSDEDFKIFSAFTRGDCATPQIGQHFRYEDCAGSPWLFYTNRGIIQAKNFLISCPAKHERKILLNKQRSQTPLIPQVRTPTVPTNTSALSHGPRPSFYQGRPVTYNMLVDPTNPEMMFCQDRPEVEQLSGRSCEELESTISCEFLLADAGVELPENLPKNATLSVVCPETCQLCVECAPGCFLWFLGNGYCDPSCNIPECSFDAHDCTDSPKTESRGDHVQHLSSSTPHTCHVETFNLPWYPYGIKKSCADLFLRMKQTLPHPTSDPCEARVSTFILDILNLPHLHDLIEWNVTEEDIKRVESSSDLQKEFVHNVCPLECQLSCLNDSSALDNHGETSIDFSNSPTESSTEPFNVPESTTQDVEPLAEDLCEDDPMVKQLNYTCALLKITALRRLGKGCEVRVSELLQFAKTSSLDMGGLSFPAMTRLVDACPKTCECCSCLRFRRPRVPKGGQWRIQSTLSPGEHANCVHDSRIEELTSLSCFEIVDSLRGHCSVKLSELVSEDYPSDLPETLTLADACGVACGQCPICEDSFLVEQEAGFSCSQIIQMYDHDCDVPLKTLVTLPESIPEMAQLKHVCPKSCGLCDAPYAYRQALYVNEKDEPLDLQKEWERLMGSDHELCQDHPNIAMGVTCDILFQYSNQDCEQTLQSMGVDLDSLPTDLHPLSLIAEACPKTCSTCESNATMQRKTKCVDHPLVKKMNQSCSVLIQVGHRGCNTFLGDFGQTHLPDFIPKQLRVKDVCRSSCGLCVKPSCSDNFQNGQEEGVDCGGGCRSCRSCNSGHLKSFGPAYIIQGFGIDHGSNRTLFCQQEYVRESGQEPTVIYCEDGVFTKSNLVCGEKKKNVFRSYVRLLSRTTLNATVLPSLYLSFLEVFLREQSHSEGMQRDPNLHTPPLPNIDLRFLRAGDCTELASLEKFVCQDNPQVQRTGYDCTILSRLGCSKLFSDLAREHNAELPPDIPRNASVADACPVTCRACDALKRKLSQLKMSNYLQSIQNISQLNPQTVHPDQCLQVDFVIENTTAFTTPHRSLFSRQQLRETASKLSRSLKRQLQIQHPLDEFSLMVDELETVPLSLVHWNRLYKIPLEKTAHLSEQTLYTQEFSEAQRIFIVPGLPMPVFDAIFVPDHLELRDIIGQMYRPIVGVGEEFTTEDLPNDGETFYSFGDKRGVVTGWYDSSGSASVISPVVEVVANICRKKFYLSTQHDHGDTCCSLKQDFEKFLAGPCGTQLYDRVISEGELETFCSQRTQSEEGVLTGSHETFSCYETALRLLEPYRHRPDPSCVIVQYVQQLIHVWCSKDTLPEFLTSHESIRPSAKFCFPFLKQTLQKRFDVLYVSSFSDDEMKEMCKANSCTRHHLRYIDALTQVTLAWMFSSVHIGFNTFHLKEKFLRHNESGEMGTTQQNNDSDSLKRTRHIKSLRRLVESNAFPPLSSLWTVSKLLGELKSDLRTERSIKGRHLYSVTSQHPQQTLGSYLADFPELFLDFMCFQANGHFCQQTLLLLVDEDFTTNPFTLAEPCKSPCFVPMVQILGGYVQFFGERRNHPYYKTLGGLLRSYGRFYCTMNSQGQTCGSLIFKTTSPLQSQEFPESPFHFSKLVSPRTYNLLHSETLNVLSSQGCSASFINDGQCDPKCFTNSTLWDGDDCRIPNMIPEPLSLLQKVLLPLTKEYPKTDEATTKTSCLFYDASFVCSKRCFDLYKQLSESLGCCLSAALETLASLLQTEAEHPALSRDASWVPERSINWLEQSCHCTLERTCRGRNRHGVVWRLDVFFHNLAIRSRETNLPIPLDSEQGKLLIYFLQHTLAQTIVVSDTDITRIIIRRDSHQQYWAEVFIESDKETPHLTNFFSNSYQQNLVKKLLERRLYGLPFHFEPLKASKASYPTIVFGFPNSRIAYELLGRLRGVPFDVSPSLPTKGMLGLPGWNPTLLRNQPCLRNFQEIGKGYRILPSDALDVQHGASRTLRCSKNYYPLPHNLVTDTLICDNGRWIKQHGLMCLRRCFHDDLWRGRSRAAYQVLGGPKIDEWSDHGVSVFMSCATNCSASRGLSRSVATCNDGAWEQPPFVCKHNCKPFIPPEPVDGYAFDKTNQDTIYHGTQISVSCLPGFFYFSYTLEDENSTRTRCEDGQWLPIKFRCVKPNKIVIPKSPTLVSYLFHQLFTGVGMIGLLIGLGVVFIAVVIIAISWTFYFKHIAKNNAQQHKQILHDALDTGTNNQIVEH